MNMFKTLMFYFEFPFVRYALIVAILIGLCTSLLGVILVLKRFSFIGDGLSHVAFGAMSIATVCNITNNMLITLPITFICAVVILCGNKFLKVKGEASIALISVSSLAIGYILVNVINTSSNVSGDVCTSLFGSTSILTLSNVEVWLSVILSLMVLTMFILFYNKIFSVTFDEGFAKATGTKTELYNLLLAFVISIVIVLAMKLVGSLLITALIIFPALSAMKVFKSYLAVIISSGVISVVCAVIGILFSILFGTPVGSTIVIANLLMFIIFSLIGLCFNRRIV